MAVTTLTLDGTSFHVADNTNGPRLVGAPEGFFGTPPVRDAVVDRPDADGAVELEQVYGARVIGLQGVLRGVGASVTAKWTDFYTRRDLMVGAAARGVNHALVVTRPDGTQRTATVRTVSELEFFINRASHPKADWRVQFRAADPLFYSVTGTTVTFDPSTQGVIGNTLPDEMPDRILSLSQNVTVTNNGNYPTQKLVITFTGPWTSPSIQNDTRGEALYTRAILGSGETLVVEPHNRRTVLNGTETTGMIDWTAGSRWTVVNPGANTFRFGGVYQSTVTLATVQTFHAYLAA